MAAGAADWPSLPALPALPARPALPAFTAPDVPQFQQVRIGRRPGALGQRKLRLCGAGVAIMLRYEAERVVGAGVTAVLRRELAGGEPCEVPVAGLPRRPRNRLDREQRLGPGVGAGSAIAQPPDDFVEHRTALLGLARPQEELALEDLEL